MTLVDVLAGIAILASTVLILAPMAADARAAHERTALSMQAQAVLIDTAPPVTPSGERSLAEPAGCRLRWSSELLEVAPGDRQAMVPSRSLRCQIVSGNGETPTVLAERMIPQLGVAP